MRVTWLWVWTAILLAGCPWGRGSKKLGEACRVGNDCANAHCTSELVKDDPSARQDPSWVCTQTCTSDADCVTSVRKLACKVSLAPVTNPEKRGICVVAP